MHSVELPRPGRKNFPKQQSSYRIGIHIRHPQRPDRNGLKNDHAKFTIQKVPIPMRANGDSARQAATLASSLPGNRNSPSGTPSTRLTEGGCIRPLKRMDYWLQKVGQASATQKATANTMPQRALRGSTVQCGSCQMAVNAIWRPRRWYKSTFFRLPIYASWQPSPPF
jgi:hypothetical protein